MNRVVRIAAFAFGAGLLVFLVRHSGAATLWHTILDSAWVIGPVILLWGIVYGCNARAWQLLIPDRPAEFTWWRAFPLTIACFAMNFTAPGLSFGGEPLKVIGATPMLGQARAVGSTVSFRFLHGVAHMMVLLAAIIPAALLLRHTPIVFATLAFGAVLASGAALFLLSSHREGIFERGVALIGRVRPLRWLARRLEGDLPRLQELDREMRAVHTAPGQFRRALATEIFGRVVGTMEFAVILYGLGLGVDLPRAFVIANLGALFTTVMFFTPFELGAKEGAVTLVFAWLGLPPELGTSAALLSRVRELVWAGIGIGTVLLLDAGKRAGALPAQTNRGIP